MPVKCVPGQQDDRTSNGNPCRSGQGLNQSLVPVTRKPDDPCEHEQDIERTFDQRRYSLIRVRPRQAQGGIRGEDQKGDNDGRAHQVRDGVAANGDQQRRRKRDQPVEELVIQAAISAPYHAGQQKDQPRRQHVPGNAVRNPCRERAFVRTGARKMFRGRHGKAVRGRWQSHVAVQFTGTTPVDPPRGNRRILANLPFPDGHVARGNMQRPRISSLP